LTRGIASEMQSSTCCALPRMISTSQCNCSESRSGVSSRAARLLVTVEVRSSIFDDAVLHAINRCARDRNSNACRCDRFSSHESRISSSKIMQTSSQRHIHRRKGARFIPH
jgi:hypothetical protein